MKKTLLFSLAAATAGVVLCFNCPRANASYPSFSFSNTGTVSFTDLGGVSQFTDVPVDITDPTYFFGASGTLSGTGTPTDYNVTLLDDNNSYNLITAGDYVTEPFPFIEADDSSSNFTATEGINGNRLSGTYVSTAPEASTIIAFGSMLVAGGVLLGIKRQKPAGFKV